MPKPKQIPKNEREVSGQNGKASKVGPPISEAFLQRTVHEAINGPNVAMAICELQRLLSFSSSRDVDRVYLQALSVISHHLRPPHPIGKRSFSYEEASGMNSLFMLFDLKITRSSVQEAFLLAHLDDILRWMVNLFTRWVLDWPPSESEQIETSPTDTMFGKQWNGTLAKSIPHNLRTMFDFPAVHARIMEDECHSAQVGSLLAQITIVQGRNKDIDMFNQLKSMQAMDSNEIAPPYASAFFEFLGRDLSASARFIVSHLQHYSDNDDASPPFSPQLLTHIRHLERCTCMQGSDALLDACIERESLISTLMSLFLSCAESLNTFMTLQASGGAANMLTMIIYITHILSRSFVRSGALCISFALNKGLLKAILSVNTVLKNLKMSADEFPFKSLDIYMTQMVESVIIHSVYPSVFRRAVRVFDIFDPCSAKANPPLHMLGLNSALVRLTDKIHEERLSRIGRDTGDPNSDARAYRLLYGFCDNVDCPNQGNSMKLGRCTACGLGFYCSRYCQKIVWKERHRHECKRLALSKEGRNGVPSMLTVHDYQFFLRTLPQRLQCYRNHTSPETRHRLSETTTENKTVRMDLTTFPVEITVSDDPTENASGRLGPLITAKFPTGASFNEEGGVYISAMGTKKL